MIWNFFFAPTFDDTWVMKMFDSCSILLLDTKMRNELIMKTSRASKTYQLFIPDSCLSFNARADSSDGWGLNIVDSTSDKVDSEFGLW